jgi:dihydroorotate dehydrogenase (fumarate)
MTGAAGSTRSLGGVDLTTRYMGLQLKNPLVASASPFNANLDNIRQLEEAGVAAIVLPSIFEEQIAVEMARYEDLAHISAESFQEAQTFFPEYGLRDVEAGRYLELIRRAVATVDVPVIASLNGTTAEGWIAYARQVEEAGARGLELNIYFIPTDLALTGRDVEQRYLDIVRAVRAAVTMPLAVKLNPYFSAMGNMAIQLDQAGADALVLFNRFYQPDIDLVQLRIRNDLELSAPNEIRLPLLWIAVLAGRVGASLAASTGVQSSDEILKYLLAGADVVMTTSALLRHGVRYVESLLAGVRSWLAVRNISSLDHVRGMLSHGRVGASDVFERANYMAILRGYGGGQQ